MNSIGITASQFIRLSTTYRKRWGANLLAMDVKGAILLGQSDCAMFRESECAKLRKRLLDETLRWGEAASEFCTGQRLIWVLPLMRNNLLTGGIIAEVREVDLFPSGDGKPLFDIRDAADDLRQRLEEESLTNGPLLDMRRENMLRERRRAEAIHSYKALPILDFRTIYLREEPALMSAIRKGDRQEARGVLNSILTVLHHQAGDRLNLVKSFFLELVVLMSRTAIEAGGDPEELLGANYSSLVQLSKMDSEEPLGIWVHDILDRLIDAIHRHRNSSPATLLHSALTFMQEHLSEDISRDDAARAAHLSPAHFSRLFAKQLGRSFTDFLNQMRVDRAVELLVGTDRSLSMVALDCGFRDQSYFTKVFNRHMKMTPREYRRRLASRAKAGKPDILFTP